MWHVGGTARRMTCLYLEAMVTGSAGGAGREGQFDVGGPGGESRWGSVLVSMAST
jgi:hypothetical protein